MNKDWISGVKGEVSVGQMATELGLSVRGRSAFGPCPRCGATKRASEDSRPPIGYNQASWSCFYTGCGAKGDAVELACLVLCQRGSRELDNEGWAKVRAWLQDRGMVRADGPQRSDYQPPRMPRAGQAGDDSRSLRRGRSDSSGEAQSPPDDDWGPGYDDPSGEVAGGSAGGEQVQAGGEQRRGGQDFAWGVGRAERAHNALFAEEDARPVLEYLRDVRRLSEDAIREFKLGAHVIYQGGRPVERWVVIPLLDQRGEVVNLRFRSVPGPCLHCGAQGCARCQRHDKQTGKVMSTGQVLKAYRVCGGRPLPLYGSHLMSDDLSTPVIMTEGELDVVALWTYGFVRNVVSGTGGAGTVKDEWLDQLEPFETFLLAYDDDGKGEEGAKDIAKRLGEDRCSRVILPHKDAGECLERGVDGDALERAIQRAKPMVGLAFKGIAEYEADIEALINNPQTLIGASTGSKKLDKLVGGLPPGLVVITGDTGAGKTSFTHWLVMGQALQGRPGVVTSFEQRPIGSVQKFLRMQVGGDFTKVSVEERRRGFEALDRLPIRVLDHYGNIEPDDLIKAVRFARRRYASRWFLVDHLGFLVDPGKDDERRQIDGIVRKLAVLAVNEGITIFLICHPTTAGAKAGRRVMLSDLKGASSIQQDAHLGLVVEKIPPTQERAWAATKVHVDKVRSEFGISGGSALLAYDHVAILYADTPEELGTRRS